MSHPAGRSPDHEIEPFFVSRWSRRAFGPDAIADSDLLRAFEAARWAPSGGNVQPWRFLYAKRDGTAFRDFLSVLNERNQIWAAGAAVLIAILSRKVRDTEDGGTRPHRPHSFDAGAAWSNLAHQAHLLGWGTRAIGGFDAKAARKVLQVPEEFEIEAFIALGRPAEKSALPDDFQGLENPSGRKPVSEFVREGIFSV
jgi:nitroreductase